MAFADRVVVKRLLIERLKTQLALASSEAGVEFLPAAAPPPAAEATHKWVKIARYGFMRPKAHQHPDGSGAERVKGPQTGTFVLILAVTCRVSQVDESDYAWDSAAGFVERAFVGANPVDPASPSTPVHTVNVLTTEAVQDASDPDGGEQMFTGTVTVTGTWKRATGDSLEVRPPAV